MKIFIKKKILYRHYDKLSQNKLDLNKPYILLALHLQPERSTLPEGGIFADQLLMVDIIANALPEGWLLYIKENPKQFKVIEKQQGNSWRDYEYYNRMASYDNVRFVPISRKPFKLIDNSKAVATVTGTIGWEAVLRGKPALVFGSAWYQSCEGIFKVSSLNECKNALAAIKEGYNIDEEKVKLFLNTIEDEMIRTVLINREREQVNSGYKDSVSVITDEVLKTLR